MIKRLVENSDERYQRPQDSWQEVPLAPATETDNGSGLIVRKRSLRSKRRIFTLSCTAFTIGALMIILTSPSSNEFLAPGPLGSNHAQILAGQGADRCAACHAAANGTLAGWIANTFSLGKSQGLSQSELCMKCHDKSFVTDTAMNPHNVHPETLADLTAFYEPVSYDAGMIFQPPVSGHQIECSACHREHHGTRDDLTAMTDKQCQSCHQSTFHSFEIDHPEFQQYPLKQRSKIAFDHSSHSLKHFPSKQSEFNCNQCHLDDNYQNVKQLASYENACASCHQQQVLDSGRTGLALIALPMLDMEAIEAENLQVGSWPLAATGDFDGPFPPIMRVLLTADPVAAEILQRVGPTFDFADIDPDSPSDVQDAVKLVWSLKRLLQDLASDGPRAVRSRLESVMMLDVSDAELQKMVSNLDAPVFQNAVRRWIPDLNAEITAHSLAAGLPPRQPTRELKNLSLTSQPFVWPDDEALLMRAVKIVGKQNQDDVLVANPLVGLIEPASGVAIEQTRPLATVRIPRKNTERKTDDLHSGPPDNTTSKGRKSPPRIRLTNQHLDPMSDPDLLAVNPLQEINAEKTGGDASSTKKNKLATVVLPAPVATGVLLNQPTLVPHKQETDLPSVSPRGSGGLASQPGVVAIARPDVDTSERPPIVVPSGWFRDDKMFRISYIPSGHADACVQSWIELVTRASDANTRPETKQLFNKTLSMTSVGLCRTCHTVDQLPDRSFHVNWKAENRDPAVRSFTRFSHGPHLIQPNLQDCSHCHSMDAGIINADSFQGFDSTVAVSNFAPITKSNCSSCHSANQTNNSCTQCHSYHVGSKIISGK
ncbi:MAG: hypothetical protein ACI814_004134 [Mariniblastus sp.]|jgi:hypothetical protein